MRRCLLSVGLVLLMGCASRAPLPSPSQPLVPTPKIEALEQRPALVTEQPSGLPKVRSFRLANGLVLYALESHAFPQVAAAFVSLRGGEDLHDLEHAGLPSLITEALLASASIQPPRAARTKTDADAPITIDLGGATLRHTALVTTMVESKFLADAVASLADVVREPILNEQVLARARKAVKAGWDDERFGIAGVAHNHITQRLYGPAHVLGQHADMAVKRIDEHTLDQVIKGYEQRYVPAAGALVLVGDLDPVAASLIVNQEFGSWARAHDGPRTYDKPDWKPRGKRKIFLHARMSVAHIALGQHGPAPSSADYVPTEVLSHLLGGSYNSRLMTSLRGEAGLAYSVHSALMPRRDGSLLTIATEVARDDAEDALKLIGAEVRALREELVTPEELTRAKTTLRQALSSRYEAPSSALGAVLLDLELGESPVTRPAAHLAQLEALTPAELRATAERVLDPRAPVIVIGDLRQVGALGRWAAYDDEEL